MDADNEELIAEIRRRIASGEIKSDQVRQALKPKRGRPQKRKGMYIRRDDGTFAPLITPEQARKRAKETPKALEIGKFYVDLVESGTAPVMAMSKTLRQYSTKLNHIEDSTVRKYATYWRGRRERDRIRRVGMLEAIRKGMEALNARTDINDDDLL